MLLKKAEHRRVEPSHGSLPSGGWHGTGKARIESRHHSILNLLNVRFGSLPGTVPTRVRAISDFETLESFTVKAAIAESLEDFVESLDEQAAQAEPVR
jgi:hypothetical protein